MATFKNHFYKLDNQIRKQQTGGATGLRATGSLSRVTMDKWITEFRRKVESAGAKKWLLKKYLDDVMVVATNMRLGSRWEEDRITWSEETKRMILIVRGPQKQSQ